MNASAHDINKSILCSKLTFVVCRAVLCNRGWSRALCGELNVHVELQSQSVYYLVLTTLSRSCFSPTGSTDFHPLLRPGNMVRVLSLTNLPKCTLHHMHTVSLWRRQLHRCPKGLPKQIRYKRHHVPHSSTASARVPQMRKRRPPVKSKPVGFLCVNKMMNKVIGKVLTKARNRDDKRRWRAENPELSKERNDNARKKFYNESKHKVLGWNKQYRAEHYDQYLSNTRFSRKERRKHDIVYVIKDRLRARLSSALRRKKAGKMANTMRLVGCDTEFLSNHLCELTNEKEIDHIFPFQYYNLEDVSQQQNVMNYMNLQILTLQENGDKSSKLPTKAMACKVPRHLWPPGITEDMLPDIFPGWSTPLRM